jgi:hypothetical protein
MYYVKSGSLCQIKAVVPNNKMDLKNHRRDYGGPFCQDKKSACVKIQNPPSLLVKNLEGQVRFMSL